MKRASILLFVPVLFLGACGDDDGGDEPADSTDADRSEDVTDAGDDGSEEEEILAEPVGPRPFGDYLEVVYGDEDWYELLNNVQTGGPDDSTTTELRLFMRDGVTEADALEACEAAQGYAEGVGEELEVVVDTVFEGANGGAELVIAPAGGQCEPVAG
jgi:hypothetical protein